MTPTAAAIAAVRQMIDEHLNRLASLAAESNKPEADLEVRNIRILLAELESIIVLLTAEIQTGEDLITIVTEIRKRLAAMRAEE